VPTDADYTAFRKYVGDIATEAIDEDVIDQYLDDATIEATAPHVSTAFALVTSYDNLPAKYSPEVILLAAINWWTNKLAVYSDKLSTTVGQASENASDRWTHALQMIEFLQDLYDNTKILGSIPDMGNLSHWDRNTLSRVGGQSEEEAKSALYPGF